MSHPPSSPAQEIVRPLLRVRQVREFTAEPVDDASIDAIADAARWSGSGQNSQPWRFIVVRREETVRALAQAGLPLTRPLLTARAAIAIVEPSEQGRQVSIAFDEGRAAERMLVAATLLGLASGICWVAADARENVAKLLGVPADHFVRTIVAVGHPTEAARRPKSAPGEARRPRPEMVFEERWPEG